MPAPISYTGLATTPRIFGNAETSQRLFAIENRVGSKKLVRVRRFSVQMEHTAALTSVKAQFKLSRTTGTIGNGERLGKGTFDTAQTSDPLINIWYAGAPDGNAIGDVVGTAAVAIWKQFAHRMHTGAEQIQGIDKNAAPVLIEQNHEFRIYPGEYVLLELAAPVIAANPITNAYVVQTVWTEEAFNTFAVSGTVTLSASPYTGAEVIVLIADDENGTNLVYWETVVSSGSGTWSSNIPVGKVAFAYAQDSVVGPTRYTSEGRPYLKQ